MRNGWSMTGPLGDWLEAMTKGLPGDNLPVITKPVRLYSCKNVPIGGAVTNSFQFFDEKRGRGVQSIAAGGIPANQALALTSIRFGFQYGFSREGKRLGLDSPSAAQKLLASLNAGSLAGEADHIGTQWKAAETIREFFDQGFVSFSVQDELIFELKGLTSLPDGKAVLPQAAIGSAGTFSAATNVQDIVQSLSNGAPFAGNKWAFPAPWPLPAQQGFKIEVNHQQAVDFADTDIGPLAGQADTVIAGTLTCELEGILASAR